MAKQSATIPRHTATGLLHAFTQMVTPPPQSPPPNESPYHAASGALQQPRTHQQPASPYPQGPKPKSWRGLIAGAVLLLVLLVLGYGMFAGFDGEVSAADRTRLLTATHLAEVYPDAKDAAAGRFTRTRYIDGSIELNYELESDTLYLSSQISYETSKRSARDAYTGMTVGAKAIFMLDESTTEQLNESLPKWGDRSRWSTMMVDGKRSGHVFVGQRGHWTVMFTVGGISFESDQDFADFLTPHLDRMTAGSL